MSGIVFTEEQQKAIDRLVEWAGKRAASRILLQGQAGTGKSTIIQEVLRQLGHKHRIAMSAPTNKATKVLKDMSAKHSAPVVDIRTIYSILGLQLRADGSVKSLHRRDVDLDSFDIIVVDEASMLNRQVYNHLLDAQYNYDFGIIFIGDALQLPPVNEEDSPVFMDNGIERIDLLKPVRQAEGSPIIQLASVIRKAIEDGGDIRSIYKWAKENQKVSDGNGGGFYYVDWNTFNGWMAAGFSREAYSKNPDLFRYIAWRNVKVNEANDKIRRVLYNGEPPVPFGVGEHVLSADVVRNWSDLPRLSLSEEGEMVMRVDDEGYVTAVHELGSHPLLPKTFRDIEVYEVSIALPDSHVKAYMPTENSRKKYQQQLDDFAKLAKKDRTLWQNFWGYKESFADIRPAHAITSHRSQGSTYTNVFVHGSDIMANRNKVEALKSLYVAVTRASSTVVVTL